MSSSISGVGVKTLDLGVKTLSMVKDQVKDVGKTVGKTVSSTMKYSSNVALTLIRGSEEGKVRDSGFVTFSTLLAKNQCQQMIHHASPFKFFTKSAPKPEDIIWEYVGITHKQQQIYYLLAQAATIFTCIFWTIPVSFIASLSELEHLKGIIPGLDKALENHAWLSVFFRI